MSGSDFTQFKGLPRDDEDAHQIVTKDNPLPVTLQSEEVNTDQSDGSEEAIRDGKLLDKLDEILVQLKIMNLYNELGQDEHVTETHLNGR